MAFAKTDFRLNRRDFDEALRRYVPLSKSSLQEVCNRKSFYITRRACLETPKASRGKIKREMEKDIVTRTNLLGRKISFSKKGKIRYGAYIKQNVTAPLAALIINARRGRKGQPGLYGSAMAEAVHSMEAARLKSIAFLKSGWLPAIKILASVVKSTRGAAREDRTAEQIGSPKGSATPARDAAFKVRATFTNSAGGNRDNQGALPKYAGPALQAAFDAEASSTMIEVELREAAQKAGIKTR